MTSHSVVIEATAAHHDQRAIGHYSARLAQAFARSAQWEAWISITKPLKGKSDFGQNMLARSWPGRLDTWLTPWSLLPPLERKKNVSLAFYPGNRYVRSQAPIQVFSIHGLAVFEIPDHFPGWYVKQQQNLVRAMSQTCSHFVAISPGTYQKAQSLLNIQAQRLAMIPLGVEAQPQVKVAEGFDDAWLYVGGIQKSKNLEFLNRVAGRLRSQGGPRVVAVGPCLDLQPEDLPYIECHSPRPRKEVLSMMAGSLGLVHPTLFEGWASPPLEAFSVGRTCVVSDLESLRDSTGGLATYLDPHDERAWLDVLMQPHKLERDQIKIADFLKRHSWERCFARHQEVFRKWIDG